MTRNFVASCWRGEGRLWLVFWIYGVLLSTIVTGVFLALLATEDPIPGLEQFLIVAFIPYTVWILVSIWRCAFNVENKLYGHMAQALTIAWAINATLLIISAELGLIL